MIETTADIFIKQGIERGIKQGIERERKERCKNIKEYVIKCLRSRFNVPVPHDIQNSINSYSDLIAIDSLFQQALDCESLDDFRGYLV